MSDVAGEWSYLQSAWRFASVLTGCQEGAAKVFPESIQELLRHPHGDEPDRARSLLFTILRKRCLRFPARCELPASLAPLHRQLEPDRSALALLCLNVLPPESIRHILGVEQHALKNAMKQNDTAVAQEVQSLPIDEVAMLQIREGAQALAARQGGMRLSVRNPATIAVGLGFLLLVAILVWHLLGQAGIFPDEAIKIATAGGKASPDQFEAVEEKAGGLQDWFMLKGYDSFRVPPGLENFDVVGVRNFKVENEPVAQAAVPDNTMFFYSFAARPFGINISPEKSWRITEADHFVLAIREEAGTCFLIAFRGKKQDMLRVLREAGAL